MMQLEHRLKLKNQYLSPFQHKWATRDLKSTSYKCDTINYLLKGHLHQLTLSKTRNASLISSSLSVSFIFLAIIVRNSGKSMVPLPGEQQGDAHTRNWVQGSPSHHNRQVTKVVQKSLPGWLLHPVLVNGLRYT